MAVVRPRGRVRRAPAWAVAIALALSVSIPADALAVTWSGSRTIAGAGSGWATPGSLAVSSSTTVHVAYEQAVLGGWGVYYRRSTNSGTSWDTPFRLSRLGIGEASSPSVEAYGSTLDAVWLESDDTLAGLDTVVMYRRSTNGGTTWTDAVALTPPLESAGPPRIARRGSQVIMVWTNQLDGRIYARASVDGGGTWKDRFLLSGTTRLEGALREGYPAVAFGKGIAYVVFYSGPKTLRVRRTTTGGSSWSSAVTLASNGSGWRPSVAASGSVVVVGYAATTSSDTWAVIRRSSNKGASWASAQDIGGRSAAYSFSPTVAVRGSRWMAAFERCATNKCSTSDTYYRASTSAGSRWSSASKVSVRKRKWAAPSDVDVATKTLVVYTDMSSSAWDVYVRQGS